ncbi:4'-phosphopantetheinyl transferase superfamily protein [Antribacter sp. KLBMP9083]|uniref:4'-phosphopantetheinyl transferase superfamily protein n=1 Tax=Antribacter soli TaxID=2910976 RepID=A0AA41UDS1_9MICO|nr:4'-phosphopantetheinyl transferase superfamily protein [Antribacter soli]MCF4123374.1 4'-phosphopantetheinyl transferase superfamily protein [Antribacter soli]
MEPLTETLHPSEAAYLARAVESRRQQFTSVRACARTVLAQMGINRPPMVPGMAGRPPWPPGVVGSMTHTDGFCAAAASSSLDARSIGIDAEPIEPLPDGVLALVALPSELTHLRVLAAGRVSTAWDRLLFSAKESVYKAWYPVVGSWLEFEDIRLRFDLAGTFSAELVNRRHGSDETDLVSAMQGRWLSTRAHVVTGVFVPA